MGDRRRILLAAVLAFGGAGACDAAARTPAAYPSSRPEVRDGPVAQPDAAVSGKWEEGLASYYAHRFTGRKTASGERYNPEAMTAAHRTLPFGTRVKVTRDDGRAVVVRINDRGPHSPRLVIDVSEAAARRLHMMKAGLVRVRVEQLH